MARHREGLAAKHTQEESFEELSTTDVSPRTARATTWVFVGMLALVPLLQAGSELAKGRAPGALSLFAPLRDAVTTGRPVAALRELVSRARIERFEKKLEGDSIAKSAVQPRLQAFLTGALGAGTHQVVRGRDGTLFFQPGLEHVFGAGATDPAFQRAREKKLVDRREEAAPAADPLPALLDLAELCRRIPARFVVVPVPDKASLDPAALTSRLRGGARPRNRDWDVVLGRLRGAGIDVVDLFEEVPADRTTFVPTDTHWTPTFLATVSEIVARHVRPSLPDAEPGSSFEPRIERKQVSGPGDLVEMLKLPPGQQLFPPQQVMVDVVIDPATSLPVKPDPDSPVLLLGDSFVNVYSVASLGFGEGAGFAEQLARRLGRRIDVVAINGGGDSGVRKETAARPARELAAKRVVVYLFAARYLTAGNWPRFEYPAIERTSEPPRSASLVAAPRSAVAAPPRSAEPTSRSAESPRSATPAPPRTSASAAPPAAAPRSPSSAASTTTAARATSGTPAPASAAPTGELVVEAIVERVSKIPEPFSAPYDDCLAIDRLTVDRVVSGSYDAPVILVVFRAMEDNVWLPAASYAPGQKLRLRLIRFRDAPAEIRATQRVDETGDYEHTTWFALAEERR